MRPYVLDTNVYIRAIRSEAGARALEAFSSAFAPALHLHAVVALELLAGATTAALRGKTESSFIRPFERRRRVVTPGLAAWKRAGEIVGSLIGARELSREGMSRSFVNDCLLAASAREHGFVLVTENTRDFELIATVSPFEFVAPWPE
ncbi:MAG TPA: type II toxin-antitoxin system VapC family toxin [Longimicrobiales bacterium]|nr:type II toxin-antitoxin system VapC family toxin [Longimicrobiales bacterium]